ncbi:MAG: amidohydrolase [Chloroflexi bacterium]|nr:amidohydrolase [Chloroflexota bacterium]
MNVDIILTGGTVVTMNPARDVFENGAIAILAENIVAVGPAGEIAAAHHADTVVDCAGQTIIPGLINAHTHVPMSLLRGLADDRQLDVWLYGYMLPVERAFVCEAFCRLGTLLSCAEMIRGGTTCFVDMYYFEGAVAQAAAEAGMRAICGETIMNWSTPDAESYDESLAYCEEMIKEWKDHPLIVPAVAPHAPYSCTAEVLQLTRQLALRYDVPLIIHLSETRREVEETQSEHDLPPIAWGASVGLFEAKTIAAHCVHPRHGELEILHDYGVGVAHNPTSNLKLASGVAPVAEMLAKGIAVGIGTDGAASNNDQDMFEEMRLAALLPKGVNHDPLALPAKQALALATIESARAIHLDHLIGSLESGKRADMVTVDHAAAHLTPMYQPITETVYSQLVYSAKSNDVRHVIVNGQFLLRDGQLLTVDLPAIAKEAQQQSEQIYAFLAEREGDLLSKLVAISTVEHQETFEVQVKAELAEPLQLHQAFSHPDVVIGRGSQREQYDTYLLFGPEEGRIRYREDFVSGTAGEVHPLYFLTLMEPAEKVAYEHAVVLSRARYVAIADRSLRFYQEYFQPAESREVQKRRERLHIAFRGTAFVINMDTMIRPAKGAPFLEIKSRTWSRKDAIRKTEMIAELLSILGIAEPALRETEYVEFDF